MNRFDELDFRNWFEEIRNADESDIGFSNFENYENDADVKSPSFAPPDLQFNSSSEEVTNEEESIVPEIRTVYPVLEQNIFLSINCFNYE
ncbi:hypothetical protein NPIL_479231 [Nephila pilipes]|uniref:Uncharacterized protein n=1 Tax=Nephila pilipes TaxID=299642 RepID=A0A8X6UBT5_NEPPI|nr:hypothetical protein NPIL_479231 [Nephila pilipes]